MQSRSRKCLDAVFGKSSPHSHQHMVSWFIKFPTGGARNSKASTLYCRIGFQKTRDPNGDPKCKDLRIRFTKTPFSNLSNPQPPGSRDCGQEGVHRPPSLSQCRHHGCLETRAALSGVLMTIRMIGSFDLALERRQFEVSGKCRST